MEKNLDVVKVQKLVDAAMERPRFSYPMYQNAPRPNADSFAAIRLESSTRIGTPTSKMITKFGESFKQTTSLWELEVDILFVRDSIDIGSFSDSFYHSHMQELTDSLEIQFQRGHKTELRNRSLETDWEVRTGITAYFTVLRTQEHALGTIGEATIQGAYHFDDSFIKTQPILIKE